MLQYSHLIAVRIEFSLFTLNVEQKDGELYQLLAPPMRLCVALQVFELVHVLVGWQKSPPVLPLVTQVTRAIDSDCVRP